MNLTQLRPLLQRAEVTVFAIVVISSAVLSILGAPTWLVVVAAALPWVWLLGSRIGAIPAVGAVTVAGLFILFAVMLGTTVTQLPLLGSVVILFALLGALGIVLAARRPTARPSRASLCSVLPAALGGVVFLGVVLASFVIDRAARLSWVMLGDSANNVLFAREIIYRGGVGIGAGENPVPLPSALMAIVMIAGRDAIPAQDLLRHDIEAFVQVWALCIALTCLLAGLVVAAIVRASGAGSMITALAAAGASLIPLSWFYTGYPLEFGFFNTHVALPIVFGSFLIYLAGSRFPAQAVGLLAMAATLLLAVWSPLVLIPAMLGLVVAARELRQVIRARGLALAVLAFGAIQLVAYGLLIVLPSLVRNGAFLSAPGGAYGFPKLMIVLLSLVVAGAALAAFRTLRNEVVWGSAAVVVASALGLGALLFVTRNEADPWSYYPLKFAWLASTVIVVVAAGLLAAVIQRYLQWDPIRIGGLILLGASTVGFLNWTPTSASGYAWRDPIPRILSGDVLGAGDEVVEEIFALSDPGQSHLLWRTGDPYEGVKNFWTLQMWSDSMTQNLELKRAAYGLYDPDNVDDICAIIGWMGGGTLVQTADPAASHELEAACPELGPQVELTAAR